MGSGPFRRNGQGPGPRFPSRPGAQLIPGEPAHDPPGRITAMSFYPCGRAGGKLEGGGEVRRLATEQVGDELFGLAPEAFVAARNQLARGREPALDQLLAAGQRLRAAHRATLAGGDAAALRAAAKAGREAVAGLVEAALARLREAGHPTTETTRDRVAATLHAAMASPEAADLVRHGRLTADLDPSGFGAAPGGPAAVAGRPAAASGRPATGPEVDGDRATAAEDDAAARRARRAAAVAARDHARRRARLAADQAVLATRQAERLGRLADQAEREAR